MTRQMDVEIVIPYGNPNAALHVRFVGDYKTFCGRDCDGWVKADTSLAEALDSAYTCKRCKQQVVK